jgi:YjbE family integral membrane protein
MISQLLQPQFWLAVVEIVWIDIVLSGDNAVVIAMACRDLPPRQRRFGMIIGAGSAATLLVLFTIMVSALLLLPFLRLACAFALLFIAIRLVGPQGNAEPDAQTSESLWRAVRIVVVADVIMSLDNAVAVAAVANGRYVLLGLGLAISIPIVVAGSALVLALIERFPIIVWAGGALLGWVAGELLVSDPLIAPRLEASPLAHIDIMAAIPEFARAFAPASLDLITLACGLAGAIIVIVCGAAWRRTNGATRF